MSHPIQENLIVERWEPSGGAGNELILDGIEFVDTDRAYIRVNEHFDLRVVKTDEGIVVDIFAVRGDNAFGDPLGSTYAFDAEAMELDSDD